MWSVFIALLLSWYYIEDVFATGRHGQVHDERHRCVPGKEGTSGKLNSFLWTIKRDPPSYFFGTIHVPYTQVWDYIPQNAKSAFRQSDNIFFELDLTDPYTMKSLANCQLLPHGENLSSILPENIYTRLKDHLLYVRQKMPEWLTENQKGKGLYADYLFNMIAGNWERKRPIWVMLLVNSLTESDVKLREIPVLDMYLAQEAERLKKITGAIERVDEQCVPLNDLNFSQVLFALNQTLWQHELYRFSKSAIPYTTDDLIYHYKCGDFRNIIFNKESPKVLFALNQTLWQHELYRFSKSAIPYTTDDLIYHYKCGDFRNIIFNKESPKVPYLFNSSLPPNQLKMAKLLDSYFKTELIDKRNQRMVHRVSRLLNDHPDESFFFAFGAGHFLGKDTVIDRLRNLGYEIQHVQSNQDIPVLNISIDDWRDQKSLHLTSNFNGYPLSASFFSGDLDYFVFNRFRLHKRQKHKKSKVQEDFGDLWEEIDPETRSWIEQRRIERRKKYYSNKPFNDLWIRMQTPRPEDLNDGRQQTTYDPLLYPQSTANSIIYSYSISTLFVAFCFILF